MSNFSGDGPFLTGTAKAKVTTPKAKKSKIAKSKMKKYLCSICGKWGYTKEPVALTHICTDCSSEYKERK